MSTISVPLNAELEEHLDHLVSSGVGSNRADVMRRGLARLAEEEAVNAILQSQREIREGKILRGSAREILLGK
jgi:Arc/MetJ-type ribon-helix-helix transcriptional regulator